MFSSLTNMQFFNILVSIALFVFFYGKDKQKNVYKLQTLLTPLRFHILYLKSKDLTSVDIIFAY